MLHLEGGFDSPHGDKSFILSESVHDDDFSCFL